MRALFFDFLSEGRLSLELRIAGEGVVVVVYLDLGREADGKGS